MAEQPYNYGGDEIESLVSAMSGPRFATYRARADSDTAALQLYTWNTTVGAAFYGPLQTLEVTLRNAVHGVMSANYGSRWFQDSRFLRANDRHFVDKTIQHLRNRSKPVPPTRIVAELPFRFWVALFANTYDATIWRTDLHRIFAPKVKDRRGLHETLDRLRTLRNRIAHHEPIFDRHLNYDYRQIRTIVGLLDKPVLIWLDHHSRVPEILDTKPDSVLWF